MYYESSIRAHYTSRLQGYKEAGRLVASVAHGPYSLRGLNVVAPVRLHEVNSAYISSWDRVGSCVFCVRF